MEIDPSSWWDAFVNASIWAGLDTSFWLNTALIFVLLFLSGVFSGSETALTAASEASIVRMAKDGDKRAKIVSELIANKERLLGAILLGNNLVNILASALATSIMISFFGSQGVVYATLIMTALVLIFAEVLPKTYAIANPDRLALSVSPYIRVLVALFAPIVQLVAMIVRFTLSVFGIDISSSEPVLTAHDEIRGTLDLKSREGALIKEDRDMLGSILDLNDVTLEDVMVHRKNMEMIDAGKKPEDILSAVVSSAYTRMPVYEGDSDNIIGVVHAKDVLRTVRRIGGKHNRFNVRRVMKKPWFVPEATTLREQLSAFLERNSHFAIVVDEYGAIMGLVTLEDILEEIVGDIADEHDFEIPGVKRLEDDSLVVEGDVSLRDLNRMFEWSLPDDEATTIAGLMMYESQTIPIVGQIFTFYGFTFEIMGRRRNQITQVKIISTEK
jgi:Mg2+/Co2+ transporter CorB